MDRDPFKSSDPFERINHLLAFELTLPFVREMLPGATSAHPKEHAPWRCTQCGRRDDSQRFCIGKVLADACQTNLYGIPWDSPADKHYEPFHAATLFPSRRRVPLTVMMSPRFTAV
jgi:hypothetical protein